LTLAFGHRLSDPDKLNKIFIRVEVMTPNALLGFWHRLFPDPRQRTYLIRALVMALVIRLTMMAILYITDHVILSQANPIGEILQVGMRHWDARHYLNLADLGYRNNGDNRFLLAFFPLYPYLIRFLNFLVHDYVISALLISFAATVTASYVLQDLMRRQGFDEAHIFRAFTFFCCVPGAIYLCLPFTEALFLALTLLAFYAGQQRRWFRASLAGALASATRLTGILLLPALAVAALWPDQESRPASLTTAAPDTDEHAVKKRPEWLRAAWLLLIPLGFCFYLYLNWMLLGNPMAFLKVQAEHWNQGMIPPWEQLSYTLHQIRTIPPGQIRFNLYESRLMAMMIGIVLMLGSIRRVPLSWQLYGWSSLLIFICAREAISLPRYLVVLFPIYPVLAIWTRRPLVFQAVLCASTMMMACWFIMFITGHGAI
jgi:hypothetical protein